MSLVRLPLFSFPILIKLLALTLLFPLDYPSLSRLVESTTSSLDIDKNALISFRSQLSLDPSNPISSWDQNSSPCNWTRVICNQYGSRVIGLNLSSLQLVGTISPQIGNLSFLQSLQLQNNQLTKTIPIEVCNLLRLKVLNLSHNNLHGSIPLNISNLRELKVMDLTMNKISGKIPGEVSLLSKLQILNLASNSFIGPIPPSLGNLSSLINLDFGTNNISGTIPSELSHLRNLKHLDLSINNLTGTVPPPIYNMSSLTFLALASNQLWGELPYNVGETLPNLLTFYFCINNFTGRIPGSLQNLTNIQVIRMAHNRLTGTIPPGLGNLPFLKMYNIGYNYIVNSPGDENGLDFIIELANSTQLNFLAFDGNQLEGVIPNSVGNLSKVLSKLYMGSNRIHGSIPSSISQLSGLSLLNISYNQITGSLPSEISHLEDLQVLDLSKNHISGFIPTSFGNLKMLNSLDLSGNTLVGQVPSSFGGFSNLNYLDLSVNTLNGTIPKEIFSLTSLSKTLNMSHNQFEGLLPKEIGLLTMVIYIDLSNNRLSGNIPDSIFNCKSLETLSLARNFLNGPIPSSLDNLTALQILNLSHNYLSNSIPSNLNLLNVTQLDLSFNNLEGGLPCQGIFTNLSRVHLEGNPRLSLNVSCEVARITHHTRRFKKIFIPIVATILVLFMMVGIFFFMMRKNKSNLSRTSDSKMEGLSHYMVRYDELRLATRGFSEENLIGSGGFGSVYKAYLKDNVAVAIKVFHMKLTASWKSFLVECEALRNVRHRNIVKLITSCSSLDNKNMEFLALIYEFLANGSLDDWIKGKRRKANGDGLNFAERLKVTIDVASALDYLHHDSEFTVVHCDLKPSNILLDEDMSAKVGDFGLAKLLMENMDDQYSISSSHALKGAIGYMPPEYGLGVKPSTAGDTYSFGVLLLELFTGKSPSHESSIAEQGLVAWVQANYPTQLMELLFDPELHRKLLEQIDDDQAKQIKPSSEDLEHGLQKIFEVGLSCTAFHPDRRITMTEALHKLKDVKTKVLKY